MAHIFVLFSLSTWRRIVGAGVMCHCDHNQRETQLFQTAGQKPRQNDNKNGSQG